MKDVNKSNVIQRLPEVKKLYISLRFYFLRICIVIHNCTHVKLLMPIWHQSTILYILIEWMIYDKYIVDFFLQHKFMRIFLYDL